jgi:L-asparagine oxygenase
MIVQIDLDDQEKEEVRRLVERTVPAYSPETVGEFMQSANRAAAQLNDRIRSWGAAVGLAQLGLVRNLPIGTDLPQTPVRKGAVDDLAMFSDGVTAVFSALFGAVYVLDAKVVQRHIHNIYPALEDENTQLGASSAELEWHVEDGWHPHRPSWIGLLCLRGDPTVVTRIAALDDFLLSDSEKDILRDETCRLRVDESFHERLRDGQCMVKVLQERDGRSEIVFDPEYTVYRDPRQRDLHRRVARAATMAQSEVVLNAGEFMVMNNRRAMHSRSAYTPRRDGSDRWVKRTLIVDDRVDVDWISPGVARTGTLVR